MAKKKYDIELTEEEMPAEQSGETLVLEEEASDGRAARKEKKAPKKEKKQSRFGRKIKEIFSELKKVTWPTFKTVVKQTTVVLAVVGVFLVVIFGVDYVLTLAHQALLNSAS